MEFGASEHEIVITMCARILSHHHRLFVITLILTPLIHVGATESIRKNSKLVHPCHFDLNLTSLTISLVASASAVRM